MRILFASPEMTPFERSGSLGDVVGALPSELMAQGHDAAVVLPAYQWLLSNKSLSIEATGVEFDVNISSRHTRGRVLQHVTPNDIQVFLVSGDGYFDRPGLYGEDGLNYPDNAERFVFFSKAVVELARRLDPQPDILHMHDWPAALAPVFARDLHLPVRTVLTIHNAAYQGNFPGTDFSLTSLPPEYFTPSGVEVYGNLSFLKAGVVFSDAVTTASKHYLHRIQTPEGGSGLDGVLREHGRKLRGLQIGANYDLWDPQTDKQIPAQYGPANLKGKQACRDALLGHCKLRPQPAGPVFAMFSRVSDTGDLDLLLPFIDRFLADDVRLIIVGSPGARHEADVSVAIRKHRGKLALVEAPGSRLDHLLSAGTDILLAPGFVEPNALTAIHGLRYGMLPVARDSAGLHHVLQDHDLAEEEGTAFLFFDNVPEALWDAIRRARKLHAQPETWQALVAKAMEQDFSWKRMLPAHLEFYDELLHRRPGS